MSARIHIGTSGWSYKHWSNSVFYPPNLKADKWLSFYSRELDSVEINTTFYHLPGKKAFENWVQDTPSNFVFTVKGSRFITHMKKLKGPDLHASRFLSQVSLLGKKLEVVLFQLSPNWKCNPDRLESFLSYLRHQTIIPNLRVALEIRHPSWNSAACLTLLREYGVALVYADWPTLVIDGPSTSDFVFIRRHGPRDLYASSYADEELKLEAEKICNWVRQGKDVYIYFNNDANGYAVKNALALKHILIGNPALFGDCGIRWPNRL